MSCSRTQRSAMVMNSSQQPPALEYMGLNATLLQANKKGPEQPAHLGSLLSAFVISFLESMIFVCFVALRPKSTDMVMAGCSVHLSTCLSWESLNKPFTSTSCTYFRL